MMFTVPVTISPNMPPCEVRDTPADIIDQVAARHGVSADDLRGRGRIRSIAWPRQEAMSRLYREAKMSMAGVGMLLGGRDHTTIMEGIRAHEAREQNNMKEYRK